MYCAGMVSQVLLIFGLNRHFSDLLRCDARWDNLDHAAGCRFHRLTEALFEVMGTKALWDDYGIIDGVMVRWINHFWDDEYLLIQTLAFYPWISES